MHIIVYLFTIGCWCFIRSTFVNGDRMTQATTISSFLETYLRVMEADNHRIRFTGSYYKDIFAYQYHQIVVWSSLINIQTNVLIFHIMLTKMQLARFRF